MRRKLLVGSLLVIFGLISCLMLASVAPQDALSQLVFVALGILLYILLQFPLPELYIRLTTGFSILTFILLVITLIIGKISHGAMRWLPLGPLHLQVSEFAKPILALMLTKFAITFPINTHRRILLFTAVVGIFSLPVFLQPDLGSALVLIVIAMSIIFLGVRKLKLLLPWILIALLFVFLVWNTVLYGYQRDRLTSFLSGSGAAAYNAAQSYITVGSGKIFGRGLGHGVQSQLRFLPEFHTDFFFASLAEELGLIGVLMVLGLYLMLFIALLHLPRQANLFTRLATYAFATAIFFQMAVNIGMNIRLFPITGIPLPLLSSGGSSFLSICLGLGILVRLSDQD